MNEGLKLFYFLGVRPVFIFLAGLMILGAHSSFAQDGQAASPVQGHPQSIEAVDEMVELDEQLEALLRLQLFEEILERQAADLTQPSVPVARNLSWIKKGALVALPGVWISRLVWKKMTALFGWESLFPPADGPKRFFDYTKSKVHKHRGKEGFWNFGKLQCARMLHYTVGEAVLTSGKMFQFLDEGVGLEKNWKDVKWFRVPVGRGYHAFAAVTAAAGGVVLFLLVDDSLGIEFVRDRVGYTAQLDSAVDDKVRRLSFLTGLSGKELAQLVESVKEQLIAEAVKNRFHRGSELDQSVDYDLNLMPDTVDPDQAHQLSSILRIGSSSGFSSKDLESEESQALLKGFFKTVDRFSKEGRFSGRDLEIADSIRNRIQDRILK